MECLDANSFVFLQSLEEDGRERVILAVLNRGERWKEGKGYGMWVTKLLLSRFMQVSYFIREYNHLFIHFA